MQLISPGCLHRRSRSARRTRRNDVAGRAGRTGPAGRARSSSRRRREATPSPHSSSPTCWRAASPASMIGHRRYRGSVQRPELLPARRQTLELIEAMELDGEGNPLTVPHGKRLSTDPRCRAFHIALHAGGMRVSDERHRERLRTLDGLRSRAGASFATRSGRRTAPPFTG